MATTIDFDIRLHFHPSRWVFNSDSCTHSFYTDSETMNYARDYRAQRGLWSITSKNELWQEGQAKSMGALPQKQLGEQGDRSENCR